MSGGARAGAAAAVLAAVLALGGAARGLAAPGDVIATLPAGFSAASDLAVDEDDGTFWVTSFLEKEVFHFSPDLRRRLGAIPLPFEGLIFPFAYGIAFDSRRHTLLVVDSFLARIHEVGRDGTPTGAVIDIPRQSVDEFPGALAYHGDGDGGAGSLYLIEQRRGVFLELGLDGRLIRAFPASDDPDRFLGLGQAAHPFAFDLRFEGGRLAGFLAASRWAGLLDLDLDGRFTGGWTPLDELGGDASGIAVRPFPDPRTGEPRQTIIGVVGTEARFTLLEPGRAGFPGITRFSCEREGRSIGLRWSLWKEFDAIEVLRDCDVAGVLPGDAESWQGTLDEDGVFRFSVRALSGVESTRSEACTVVAGTGEALDALELAGEGLVDLAFDGDDALLVSDNEPRQIHVVGLDLEPRRSVPVSEFFAGEGDAIGALAFDRATRTAFLYNHSQSVIGRFEYPALVLADTFDVRLPGLEGPRRRRPSIAGMTFRPGAGPGDGTLLMVEVVRDVILEVDLAGAVRREITHPYSRLVDLPPDALLGPSSSGIALVAGSGGREAWLSGGRFREGGQRRIFRVDLETGAAIAGSGIPTAAMPGSRFAIEDAPGAAGETRLYALSSAGSLHLLQATAAPVPPPELLECSHGDPGNDVELSFTPGGPYDQVEILRDCRRIALLDGSVTRHRDLEVPPGARQYAVRGGRGGRWSSAARCSLRAGAGAILDRRLVWPVEQPRLLTRDPEDGSLFLLGRVREGPDEELGEEALHRFGPDLVYAGGLGPMLPPPARVVSLAVRRPIAGERLLYFLATSPGGQVSLFARTEAGDLVDQLELTPPQPAPPFPSAPVALVWHQVPDTFYFLEGVTRTYVEIDAAGGELRRFPHPDPPPSRFNVSDAAWLASERRALLALDTRDATAVRPAATRVVEIDLDGRLTGVEVPLEGLGRTIAGFALAGETLIVLAGDSFGELLRVKAFDGARIPPTEFIRGDVNASGGVEIADPVFLLNHLFRGGPGVPCPDAADADDDGRLTITDAIRILGHLFLGRLPPAPPFPERGEDPTGDRLVCGG